jgi:LacI family transcriptional regulator
MGLSNRCVAVGANPNPEFDYYCQHLVRRSAGKAVSGLMVTVKDVALRAGVSMITVSRVVNGSSLVGQSTRVKVEEAIRELNYIPNSVASNLRSRHSDIIGLVLPDITTTFWTSIARGVEDEAWTRGYSVFICNTDEDPVKERAYVDKLLQRRVDGVLIVPSRVNSDYELLRKLRALDINYVVVHRSIGEVPSNTIRTDGYAATRKLTEILIERGGKRIAYVGMPLEDPVSAERLNGFREVMAERQVPVDERLILTDRARRGEGAHKLVTQILNDEDRPDAILLANSSIAVHALHAIQNARLTIPDDIDVATFHDITALDFYAPHLIRAVQPSYLMGRLAMRKLFTSKEHPGEPPEEIVLMPEIHYPEEGSLRFS